MCRSAVSSAAGPEDFGNDASAADSRAVAAGRCGTDLVPGEDKSRAGQSTHPGEHVVVVGALRADGAGVRPRSEIGQRAAGAADGRQLPLAGWRRRWSRHPVFAGCGWNQPVDDRPDGAVDGDERARQLDGGDREPGGLLLADAAVAGGAGWCVCRAGHHPVLSVLRVHADSAVLHDRHLGRSRPPLGGP